MIRESFGLVSIHLSKFSQDQAQLMQEINTLKASIWKNLRDLKKEMILETPFSDNNITLINLDFETINYILHLS